MQQYEIVQRLKALEDEVAELRILTRQAFVCNLEGVKLTPGLFGPGGKHQLISPKMSSRTFAALGTQSVFNKLLKECGGPIPVKPHNQAPPRPYYEIAGMSRECIAYLCRKNPQIRTLDELVKEAGEFQKAIGEHPSKVITGEWSKARRLYNFERADRLCITVARTLRRVEGEETIRCIIHWGDYQYHIPEDAREPGYDA